MCVASMVRVPYLNLTRALLVWCDRFGGWIGMAEDEPGRWLLVPEAALALRISENNLRTRLSRHRERSRRGNDGRVYVFVPDNTAAAETEAEATLSGNMLPVEAVLEIKATYEQIVLLQKDQLREIKDLYESRLADARGDITYLRQELVRVQDNSAPKTELQALHARHQELVEFVKLLIGKLGA